VGVGILYVVQRLRRVACRSGLCIFAHDSPNRRSADPRRGSGIPLTGRSACSSVRLPARRDQDYLPGIFLSSRVATSWSTPHNHGTRRPCGSAVASGAERDVSRLQRV
jgi:hypothetical protein